MSFGMIKFGVFVVILSAIFSWAVYINNKRAENCNNKGGQVVETGLIRTACIYPPKGK